MTERPDAGATPAGSVDRIGPEFFGIDVAIGPQGAESWPAFDVGAVRVALSWCSVEQRSGAYAWTDVDVKVASAEKNGAQPMLVLEGTPGFHSIGNGIAHYGIAPVSTPTGASFGRGP